MESAKLSSKSQITVPRKVREQLRIGRGDRIGFEATPDGRFIVCRTAAARKSDGAARRRLADKAQPAPDFAARLIRTVQEEDRRIRDGR